MRASIHWLNRSTRSRCPSRRASRRSGGSSSSPTSASARIRCCPTPTSDLSYTAKPPSHAIKLSVGLERGSSPARFSNRATNKRTPVNKPNESLPAQDDSQLQAGGAQSADPDVSKSGIDGLDDILCGGLTPYRLYLIEGVPGSGKTTLALQYLMEGARHGEPVVYVTLSETEEELRAMARSHNWDLDGITIRELVPPEESLQPAEQYTMFHPAEVELSETTRTILSDVERLKPTRLIFDSLSELRLLAGDPLRYRRQLLALK